ncbi:MAG: ATP-binding protein [Bacteroidales bacterium]|nr:ATP-binding protein [Bacteroidales bacterium]
MFDRDKLDKILFNLLSNAFKNTPNNGLIQLKLRETRLQYENTTKEGVEIDVMDNGKGMSKDHINNIFERFYQIDKKQQEKTFPGTGIGLSLTKGLVALHKGTIEIESDLGIGTSVKVCLLKGSDHFADDELVWRPKMPIFRKRI